MIFKKAIGFIFSFFFFSSSLMAYEYHLSACMIFQNDAPYLKEWIEFHRLLGVEHFYLFNNLSTDNYKEILSPYIKKGIVELIDWPFESHNVQEWDKIQIEAYNYGWFLALGKTKWLAILDSDEFLFPTEHDTLPEFLHLFESRSWIGGVCAYWVVYGTSYVQKVPEDKLLIETLVLSSGGASNHFKSIIRPERVKKIVSPHHATYQKGVDAYKLEIDQIRINHYWSRDEDYLYHVKIPRRVKWGTPAEACEQWSQAGNNHYDTSIFRFIGPLRQRIFKQNHQDRTGKQAKQSLP